MNGKTQEWEWTFIPVNVYHRLMMNPILMLGAAGCCWLGVVQGQDVAAPSMPEVDDDRQTPEFAREREAVATYMFFWTLCIQIAIMESDMQGNVHGGLMVKRLLNLMPENISAEYPEAFQKGWLKPLERIKIALNENPEWAETTEGKRQIGETEKMLKYLEEQYGVKKMIRLSIDWIDEWSGGGQDPPEMVLKELFQLKNDLESGKTAIPLHILCSGADETVGD